MKKIFLVILLVFVLALSVTLTACGHTHTYEEKWSYDADSHFHKSTCEHTDETDGKESHSFVVMPQDKSVEYCSVCQYARSTSHVHEMSDEYSSDENGHCRKFLCGCSIPNWAPHGFVNGVCVDCGWWKSTTDVMLGQLSELNAWDYTLLIDDVTINNVNLFSEDNECDSVTVSGELRLNFTADSQLQGEGYFEADGMAIKAVVSNGTVYACGSGKYIRCELTDLIAKTGIDLEQVQKYVDELNAETQTVRKYAEQVRQYLKTLPNSIEAAKELLNKLVKADGQNADDGLTAYVFDIGVLRQLNDILASTTVRGYVDAVLGEGFFEELPNLVEELLDTQIAKIVWNLQVKYGITLNDILTTADSLIEKFYPNDDVNTIEELLTSQGVDLQGVSLKRWIELGSALKLSTALEVLQRNRENPITAAYIMDKVNDFCKTYGDKTLYDVALADNDEITSEQAKALADDLIDVLEQCVTVKFYVDDNGVLQQVELVAKPSETIDESANKLQQLLAGLDGTILLQRDYTTEQDYSKVIEQVNEHYASLEQSAQ